MADYILGIESSCDETAAAVVRDGRKLCSNIIRSSAPIHEKYGGVVPEIASRSHLEAIVPVVAEALSEAGISFSDLSAVGVCTGPGLLGSLLVGVSAAKMLAFASEKPLISVHHLAAHIAANYLVAPELEPPFLALVVSGAHSHIVAVDSYTNFRILARTRDDAPGEAYDKISREMGLAYPGGPKLDKLAREGNTEALELPQSSFQDSLDFSFSGIKTASLNALNKAKQMSRRRQCTREQILSNKDLAASFQSAVVSVLISHLELALDQGSWEKLAIAGGVSANSHLREEAEALAERRGLNLYLPPLNLCTDNAAMTAAQAYYQFRDKDFAPLNQNATANWELGQSFPKTRKRL
ncbi:MAG: tRNA (adenosine(37)-N6)-threonylcarbamoyltransferase complex transferase subunit TsaD [Eubacteriales bacterium]|nr:tRNA (adenosine(37)-N6)-threonylcarbamoyltransferase complex transferase subunit TsaD [Eubacteriales bacterium]